MWLNWLPWRYVVRRVARARGFVDPINLLAQLHRFAEPAEVAAPLELLRAGVVFHARGLMNTGAIQHNLDWVWPYWVERQFDPHDESFIPRAFSITHVNLTHRNWTAVGLPDCDRLPLVDPRGLLTPHWDGWSLDAWIVTDDGRHLLPSQAGSAVQTLDWTIRERLGVVTTVGQDGLDLQSRGEAAVERDVPACLLHVAAESDAPGWLIVALRPYNPEGVSFIHQASLSADRRAWTINGQRSVEFDQPVERSGMSTYREGDVFRRLPATAESTSVTCEVGMVTACAMYELRAGLPREVTVRVPLASDPDATAAGMAVPAQRLPSWQDSLRGHCQLTVPDEHFQFLYDAALRTLVLHSPLDVYPGPYTYKRFWFRDAAFILHAMLCAGLTERARRTIDRFPLRQRRDGYFLSQEGEWDSNGAALWIMRRYGLLTGRPVDPAWKKPIQRAARWIERKLLPASLDKPHAGLFPAGFSAEHLGPNDYYYWDDFWGAAGLDGAAEMLERLGDRRGADCARQTSLSLLAAVDRSLLQTAERRPRPGVPASPYRRMDTGAIGSLAAGYPLRLWPADDERLAVTADFLLENCFVHGGFFQDMIHSGVNAYLTLHVAQVLLRAGDPRHIDLMRAVAELATPTGQWPEAIHPRTRGGCMGDGQHVWAAAEWLLMLRNCLVREEGERLILAGGVPSAWLEQTQPIVFGPAPTEWGPVTLCITPHEDRVEISWSGAWFGPPPVIEIRLPRHEPQLAPPGATRVVLERTAAGS